MKKLSTDPGKWMLALIPLLIMACQPAASQTIDSPNVVLILVDDMGPF